MRILSPAGLYPASYTAESLADGARHEPEDGVYTVTNTYETLKVLKLTAHLDRLEDSARRAGMPLQLDREHLRAALREMILESGFGDVRFRVTALRHQPDHYILSIEPFMPIAPRLIAEGVRCATLADSARRDAAIKGTGWMHQRRDLAESLPSGVYEGLLLDSDGYILEGLTSNFYAVRDGVLFTAGAGVLPGIAQQVVVEVAADVLPVQWQAVHVDDVPQLDEAFITSSSRGIVPVIAIDDQPIADGVPGPFTRRLRTLYDAWVSDHLGKL